MNKLKLTFLLIILSFTSYACSCTWRGNFLRTGALEELVFKGRVVERSYHLVNGEVYHDSKSAYKSLIDNNLENEFYAISESITIEIIEIIRGSEQRKRIRIFDSDGADCRANVSYFILGSTYIFSTYKLETVEHNLPNETSEDYAIYGCSENWLVYNSETNEVTGKIKGKSIRRRTITWSYKKLLSEITGHI